MCCYQVYFLYGPIYWVGNWLICNIYLQCVGTADRIDIVQDVLQDIWSWHSKYMDCGIFIGGDFNTDPEKCNDVTNHSLCRCETNMPLRRLRSYVNEPLGHYSVIDYFVCDAAMDILDNNVLDPDMNLSDRRPVAVRCKLAHQPVTEALEGVKGSKDSKVEQLRWDHAYNSTMCMLYPLYYELLEFENNSTISGKANCIAFLESYYAKVVDCLNQSAGLHVPVHYKNYYKFWCSQKSSYLKENAINSNIIWKNAGRPRSGPIADKRNADKRKYKRQLAIERRAKKLSYRPA